MLLSRNFCQKSVRVNVRFYHTLWDRAGRGRVTQRFWKISWNQFKVNFKFLPEWKYLCKGIISTSIVEDFEFCTRQMTNLISEYRFLGLAMYETWNVLYCKHKQKQYRRVPIYQLFSFLSKSLTFIEFYWFLPSSYVVVVELATAVVVIFFSEMVCHFSNY